MQQKALGAGANDNRKKVPCEGKDINSLPCVLRGTILMFSCFSPVLFSGECQHWQLSSELLHRAGSAEVAVGHHVGSRHHHGPLNWR